MKLVIQTQIRENYAAHNGFTGEYYWKCKGGNTYVVHGVTVEQSMDRAFYDALESAVAFGNESFEEYILSERLVDDVDYVESDFVEHWESPANLEVVDNDIFASRITRPDEYESWSNGIVEKRETWLQYKGEQRNYVLRYVKDDGTVTDWQGNVVKEAA